VRKGDSAQFDCVYQNANITEWYFKGKTDPISKNSTRYSRDFYGEHISVIGVTISIQN
jgi:hypothetical protein